MDNAISWELDGYGWAMEQPALAPGRSHRGKSQPEAGLAAAVFPETCRWSEQQVLSESFLPD